ncbi:MAG: RIP metalloprotease RseP [Erysipelotrichaceae bacterium]|nr:RIP metalloprotease RseP [Erysipelotrichaceae bacterium]
MTLIYFILILGIIILVHEFGHMITAKMFNVYVNEFAIGFGPTIVKKQGKETKYSLRAIPLGGFTGMIEHPETPVAFDNEGNATEILKVPVERTFYGINSFKRILILLAGPFFNMVLVYAVFIAIFSISGQTVTQPAPIIDQVVAGSPAEEAGLQSGDLITKIVYSDGTAIEPEFFSDISIRSRGTDDPLTLYIEREGKVIEVTVTPRYNEQEKAWLIGIQAPPGEIREISFLEAIPIGIDYANEIIGLTVESVIGLFTGRYGMDSLGGTISIYKYTEEAASYGFLSLLSLMGSLSVSVGLMNLIPIPVFDGGRILLTLIEIIIGHRLSEKTENIILYFGMGLVLLLFVFVTYQDIMKLL